MFFQNIKAPCKSDFDSNGLCYNDSSHRKIRAVAQFTGANRAVTIIVACVGRHIALLYIGK